MTKETAAPVETDEVEQTPEEIAAQKELEIAEAQEAFKAGFKNVRKDSDPTDGHDARSIDDEVPAATPAAKADKAPAVKAVAEKAEKKPVKEVAKPEPAPQSAEDKRLEAFNARMRNLEGNLGGIMDKLNNMTAQPAAVKKEQPSGKAVQKALTDPQEMERLVKEFPEFKPIVQGFQATQAELAAIKASIADMPKEAPKQQVLDPVEIRETIKLDTLHPDWEEVTRTSAFFEFSLEGGPPAAEYLQQQKTEQTDPNLAVRVINSWAQQYPQWWADKGHALFSTKAADSSKLLTKFKDATSQVDTEAAAAATKQTQEALRKKSNQQRLDRAKTPTGIGGAPDAGVSDQDAFRRGFKKVTR